MSKQYRLIAGQHEQGGVRYQAGQIIASDFDLTSFNVQGYQPKFEIVGGEASIGSLVWDPKTETLDAFNRRALAAQAQANQQKQDGPALVWDPKVESLDQFYQRMRNPSTPSSSSQEVTEAAKRGFNDLSGGATTAVANVKTEAQLNAMSLQDLQKYAEDEEVDLGHAKSKADIIKVLRAFQGQ